MADELDPGCWTDPNNSQTYSPTDNDETNPEDMCPNNEGIQTSLEQCSISGDVSTPDCSDNTDNDNDDLTDEADPGCHTDGDASNSGSYDPNDNDETDEGDNGGSSATSSRRRGGGGRLMRPLGKVLGTEDTCGIHIDDYLRKGYIQNDTASVIKLQNFLNTFMSAGLTENGVFDERTELAVMNFQVARKEKVLAPWGIDLPTGIFYLTTRTELNNLMCPPLDLPIPSPLIPFSTHPETPKI